MRGRKRSGFTLIELLVVISIVVLLMAMLMPALSRARKQARAVVCQSHLKQWGLHGAMLASENGGTFRVGKIVGRDPAVDWLYWGESSYVGHLTPTVRVCPMASRPAPAAPDSQGLWGGTFLAWRLYYAREHRAHYGTYGLNPYHSTDDSSRTPAIEGWRTTDARGADRIPVMLDSAALNSGVAVFNDPPECDAIPVTTNSTRQQSCINRHDGAVNGLFLDWSVRKVGLKELWTLKWYRNFETAGPWTKAGGVQPTDWPAWMRRFKEY